ncbi:S-adenosylmethionine:tRNA ribosyltransferase-isomerase [Labrys sp. LIt4]|uniref:S-adenosylmethionine:tRNA ribosyltransferase-isomerase n=1 Tax=Labrys sp. LIt4 TaxID=2821355 RepID=UPI001ADF596F|nr:S-adenosylmethionine:tRNA ribosyltransferase-isomerase [Labrys sp. LIt4]MBP0582882.1 S-adenosylmethionine:tRNA ribosyltransferase-isomerase [Labrys sp. LIt4]
MIAADNPEPGAARLLAVSSTGKIRHLPRSALSLLFSPGDLLVANDAATLPASLAGLHAGSGRPIEVRLAAWVSAGDPSRFVAVVFGAGDHRLRTEDRPAPPQLLAGDKLELGPLTAEIERLHGYPRLVSLRFSGPTDQILAGLARHGRPIQYAHVPAPLALWDMWTAIAAEPLAFEPPSAGFALDWRMIAAWRRRGVGFASLTHAAGISSTGDAVMDLSLPFDEPYRIPAATAAAIARTKAAGGRVIAIGTSVVRALEHAASAAGGLRAGDGVAQGRIGPETRLRLVDAILSGVHQPGESHFELLRAFADDLTLDRVSLMLEAWNYRAHEFGDSVLIERRTATRKEQGTDRQARITPSSLWAGAAPTP